MGLVAEACWLQKVGPEITMPSPMLASFCPRPWVLTLSISLSLSLGLLVLLALPSRCGHVSHLQALLHIRRWQHTQGLSVSSGLSLLGGSHTVISGG